MIYSMKFLAIVLYMHLALARILPRQTRSYSSTGNKTNPSSPNITPGIYLSSGAIRAEKYDVAGTGAHALHDTLSGFSPINASMNTSVCYFAVQDTININYWASYYMLSFFAPFNVTSIVTAVTHYIDTNVTRYITSVTTTSTITATPEYEPGSYPEGPPNNAPGPLRAVTELKRGADLTSWGQTFSSTGTFLIYPTVKIITVPAVTQRNGQLACTTAITREYFFKDEDRKPCGTRVFTGMNSNVQRYFDSSKFYHETENLGPAIDLPTPTLNNISTSYETLTTTISREITIKELVFPTPFAYRPDWGLTNRDDYGGYNVSTNSRRCPVVFDYPIADYGYVPQALIEYISHITSMLPPGISLLPGGPSIVDGVVERRLVAPAVVIPGQDLTVSTALTIINKGCFHPDSCQVTDAPDITTTTTSTTQTPIQMPTSRGGVPTQASNTKFPASLDKTQRETSGLNPSAVVSKVSAVSSVETADPERESPITTKAAVSSVETADPERESPITTKAAALPSQSPTSVVLPDPASRLLVSSRPLALEEGFANFLPITTPVTIDTSVSADKSLVDYSSAIPPYIVGGHRVLPGSDPVIVSGTTYSLDSSAATMVVNGVVRPLPNLEETHRQVAPVLSIGSQRLTANAASEYIMGEETFTPTENIVVVSGSTYSLTAKEPTTVLNGVTSTLPGYQRVTPAPWPILRVASTSLTADSASEYILDGQTLSPGGIPIFVSGTTYSLAPQASALVIDGTTSKIPEREEEKLTSGAIIKLGSQYLTADSSLMYVVGSETLVAGSTPIVVSGTTYSLAAQASALIVNPEATFLPQIKIGSQYLTPDSTLGYILGSETLIPGATPIVFSGTTYSLAPQASALMMNGVTSILHEQTTSLIGSTSGSSQLQYILGHQTLSPGAPAITISGVAISLAASGSTVVINGTAFPFPTGTTPSLTIGSQLLIATPASRSDANSQTSKVEAAASTAPNGNNHIMPSATNLVTFSTNSSLSTATLNQSGDENPGSVFTGAASRGGFGLTKMLGVLLVILGPALL